MDALLSLPSWIYVGLAVLALLFVTTKPASRSFDLYLADNLEAIAISIAMALVLKFFVVEAYQIPTGSMQPTILGDERTGIQDRVLADKLVTMLRDPHRWEVMIFRFPLDERRLYVKRIVGLPGEALEIHGGDVWVDGEIARKPDHVNESVLKDVFVSARGEVDLSRYMTGSGGVTFEGSRARFPEGGTTDGDVAALKLRAMVRDDYLHGYEPSWNIQPVIPGDGAVCVPDLDLALDVEFGPGASALRMTISADEGDAVFVVPRAGSGEQARLELVPGDGQSATPLAAEVVPVEGERAVPAGRSVRVDARWVDRELLLLVDGDEWLRVDQDDLGPRPDRPRRALVSVELPGGGSVDDVMLRRDIFYKPSVRTYDSQGAHWDIPEGHYFGLGDNTQASHDGRSWETKTIVLDDGRSFTGFDFPPRNAGYPSIPADSNPQVLPDMRWAFADVHGDTYVFDPALIRSQTSDFAPFIDQRYLLGKATAVFWPVFKPFRWKFIR
ncbi:MAG: signal peptidase I [Planctomycetes bacterium]|nr:signal peptidase I [Planctomycetota bacterium]